MLVPLSLALRFARFYGLRFKGSGAIVVGSAQSLLCYNSRKYLYEYRVGQGILRSQKVIQSFKKAHPPVVWYTIFITKMPVTVRTLRIGAGIGLRLPNQFCRDLMINRGDALTLCVTAHGHILIIKNNTSELALTLEQEGEALPEIQI